MATRARGAALGAGEDEVLSPDVEIEEVIADVAGNEEPVVKINRRMPDHGQEYCGQLTVTPGMLLEEEVAARWGGGKFVCQFWARQPGDTRRRPVRSVTIRIAGEPRDPKREEKQPAAPAVAASASVEARLQELQIANARLEGRLEGMTVAGAAKTAAPDPVAMFKDFAAIIASTKPAAPVAIDPLAQVTSIMGAIEKVVGVGRDLAPEREAGGTNWGPVVDRTVEAIRLLVDENRAQRTLPPRTDGGAAPAEVKALPEGTPMWQVEIAQWVPKLVGRAEGDKDPEAAAIVFLEDVSPATVKMIEGVVKEPTFVAATLAQLAVIDPRAKQYAEWFTEFLTAVQEQLTPPVAGEGPKLAE